MELQTVIPNPDAPGEVTAVYQKPEGGLRTVVLKLGTENAVPPKTLTDLDGDATAARNQIPTFPGTKAIQPDLDAYLAANLVAKTAVGEAFRKFNASVDVVARAQMAKEDAAAAIGVDVKAAGL